MKKVNLWLIIALCLSSSKLIAACNPSVAKNPPGNNPEGYYGLSQTDSFRCAINGGDDLNTTQLNERASLIPQSVNNRFYLRMGLNASSESVVNVKNKTSIYISNSTINGIVNDKQESTASNSVEFALGYTWTDFAIDLEWLALKSINYNSYLRGITPNVPFSATVKGDALLANVYWNFQNLYNLNFYFVGLLGTTHNKCTTTLTSGTNGGQPNTINKKYSVSYGIGAGVKFNLVSSLFADMAARYIALGETKFEASNINNTQSITLKGARRWIGMSVRLLWLI